MTGTTERSAGSGPGGRASDDEEQQRDRFRELLEELRTILPGVQVLLGFLMSVPFAQRFSLLDAVGLRLFAIAFMAAAVATVLLLAPASYHRLTRLGNEERGRSRRLRFSGIVTVAGLLCLLVAIVAAVALVMRLVFGPDQGLTAAIAVGALALLTWYLAAAILPRIR